MTGDKCTPKETARRRALADVAGGWAPLRGDLIHDSASDRDGVVVALPEDTGTRLFHLRPPGGGDEWAGPVCGPPAGEKFTDDVQPGNRILEIGAGTGYNAALLAHLTGPDGQVITIDVLPKVTAEARKALDETRYGQQVEVLTHDGALGAPEHAPYSRLIFTVGVWDVPQTLLDQLAPGGRLVLPLRWRGQTRGMAFTYENGHLTADGNELCGFVPMVGQDGEKNRHIDNDGHVTLYWDADQPIAPADLQNALVQPPAPIWSGTTVGPNQPFDGVWMRLTATEPGTCRIAADQTAVDSGLCKPAIPVRSPVIVEGDSLAYFTLRRLGDENGQKRWELGATGHGPSGPALAERLCEQIRAWDQDRSALPTITVYPAATPDEELATGYVSNKATSRLVITYGRPREAAQERPGSNRP